MKAVLGFVLAACVVGVVWYATRDPAPVPVAVASVTRGAVELTVSNTRAGSVRACRRSGLSMPQGGRVEHLYVKEGDVVETGQLLLALWNKDRKAQLAQAEARLAAAAHHREQFCVEADNAQREARRKDSLYERGLTSMELRDTARTRASASAFACEAAVNEEDVAAATLQLNQAMLDETLLRAPFPGVVADITGEVGEFVTPSPPGIPTPPAIDLIDYGCLYVRVPVDEVDAGRIALGQEARISLDAFRGRYFAGRLMRIAPHVLEIEKQARTVEVDIAFIEDDDQDSLLVGYSADADIVLERQVDVLRIPSEALMDGNQVWRVDDDNRLERVSVAVGLSNWNFTEIRSGLEPGDRIVLSLGMDGLAAGVRVVVTDDPS